jgi:hypothetical protein
MNTLIGGGLIESKRDPRNFQFGAVYKLPKLDEILDEFEVDVPIRIKDQKNTDYCTAYAGTAVSEDQEDIELDEIYQFHKAKQIQGDLHGWGCDLESMVKSLTRFGSIPKMHAKFSVDTPRTQIVDSESWDLSLDMIATQYRKESYLEVKGPYDKFDNIRATLWKSKAEGLQQSIITGAMWCDEWSRAKKGVVTKNYKGTFGHAFKVYGTAIKNGEVMLKCQLSNGTQFGDDGIFYFAREVVNKAFVYQAFILVDTPKEVIKEHIEQGARIDDTWFIKLIKRIIWFITK